MVFSLLSRERFSCRNDSLPVVPLGKDHNEDGSAYESNSDPSILVVVAVIRRLAMVGISENTSGLSESDAAMLALVL
jgi:hypothetical protein